MNPRIRAVDMILSGLLVFDASAFAEEPGKERDDDHEPDAQIEEIVIEAERGDAIPLMETSYSVEVFTEEELRRGTDRQMADLLQRVPNVTISPFNGQPTIRGVPQGGLAGTISNTLMYADEVYTPAQQNLWDARQVAVSRGPESYMSGGWIGGVTDVDSNDPSDEPDGNITASWAPETDDRRLGVAYGDRATDTLGYRLAAYARSSDGSFENATRRDSSWNSRDERMARAKLRWTPGGRGDTVVNLRAEYLQNRTNGSAFIGGGPEVDPFDRTAFDDLAAHNETTTRSAHVDVRHDWSDRWSSQLILAVGDQHAHGSNDLGLTAADEGTYAYRGEQNWVTAKLKLFYDSGPWHVFLRQYATRFDVSDRWEDAVVPFDFDGPGALPPIEGEVRFVYPTPDWWFVGTHVGVRREFGDLAVSAAVTRSGQTFDHGRRSVRWSVHGTTGDADLDAFFESVFARFFPQADVTKGLDDYNYLPRYIVDYQVTRDTSIGAKFERAARLGGIWFNAARGTANVYDDEFADSYDAFVRSSWMDGRLTVRANAFYTRLTDQQVFAQLSDQPNDEQIINVPRSHNDGVELETAFTDRAWNFWCSAGLLHAEFDEVEFNGSKFSGNDIPDAPDWTLSFGMMYRRDRGVFAEMDTTVRPRTKASLSNRSDIVNERRTLVNARLGWSFRDAQISLFGRNLLDEEYLEFHDGGAPIGGEFQVFTVGEPREIGLTIEILR